VSLRASGRARPNCAGDTVYDSRARILAYGQVWRRGGLTCWSRTVGLRCTNAQRHGFTLARERYTVF
jgi:hypothetical protein